MKVHVSYSDTHESFLHDFFLKTFPFEEGVSLIIRKIPQRCPAGSLFSKGWRDQMIEKQRFINRSIDYSKHGEILVFCDVDISFYGGIRDDLKESLKERDICFMKDHNSDTVGRCGGFFVLKSSEKIKNFFREVLERLEKHTDENVSFQTSEQSTINNLLVEREDISWAFLPERYYTHGLYTQGIKDWSEKDQSHLWWENKDQEERRNVYLPDDLLVHHANWCRSPDSKKDLLTFIREKFEFRKRKKALSKLGKKGR